MVQSMPVAVPALAGRESVPLGGHQGGRDSVQVNTYTYRHKKDLKVEGVAYNWKNFPIILSSHWLIMS